MTLFWPHKNYDDDEPWPISNSYRHETPRGTDTAEYRVTIYYGGTFLATEHHFSAAAAVAAAAAILVQTVCAFRQLPTVDGSTTTSLASGYFFELITYR